LLASLKSGQSADVADGRCRLRVFFRKEMKGNGNTCRSSVPRTAPTLADLIQESFLTYSLSALQARCQSRRMHRFPRTTNDAVAPCFAKWRDSALTRERCIMIRQTGLLTSTRHQTNLFFARPARAGARIEHGKQKEFSGSSSASRISGIRQRDVRLYVQPPAVSFS